MFTMQCILNQWWLDARLSYWKFFVEEKNRTFLPFDPLELANKLASIKVPNEVAICQMAFKFSAFQSLGSSSNLGYFSQFQFELWKTDTYFLNGKPTSKCSLIAQFLS